ncbi:MAG: hypothetical protein SFU85_07835 [Candidatus Methylacidiphilales bacterium]|nr:hypothetical protein [Candidatus Methylacidiphilales bacterium]
MRSVFLILALLLTVPMCRAEEAKLPESSGAAFNAEGEGQQKPAASAAEQPVEVEKSAAGNQPWELAVEPDKVVSIRKIYDFLNDPEKTSAGKSRSLAYEFKYFDHGAITESQRMGRRGQYFVVSWANHGAVADFVLRLDYRQSATRDQVRTLEIPFPKARGSFKGTFSVTGKEYREYGDVHSWRISVVRDGKIVAQERSFVW